MVFTEKELKNMERLRKLKERAPKQIDRMTDAIQKIRSEVSSEAIDTALTALASACQTDADIGKQVSVQSIHNDNRMNKNAVFSNDKTYRYDLSRVWDESKSRAIFICLNPSTADETKDDPTSRRCIQYAKSWGYGGVHIVNLFAYRSSTPKHMFEANNPVGKDNDKWLVKLTKDAGVVVAAWGNHGAHLNRSEQVAKLIPNLHSLNVNNSGEPAHPLYLKSDLKPVPYIRG